MLIPSGRVKSVPALRQVVSTHPVVRFNTYLPHTTQEENAGFAFGEPTEVSRQGKGLHWSEGRVHLGCLSVSQLASI